MSKDTNTVKTTGYQMTNALALLAEKSCAKIM